MRPMTPGQLVLFIFALAELTQAGKIPGFVLTELRHMLEAMSRAKRGQ